MLSSKTQPSHLFVAARPGCWLQRGRRVGPGPAGLVWTLLLQPVAILTQHWELESSIDLPSVSALLDQVYRPQETEHIRHNTHSHHTGPGHFPVCRVSADKVRCSLDTDTPDT